MAMRDNILKKEYKMYLKTIIIIIIVTSSFALADGGNIKSITLKDGNTAKTFYNNKIISINIDNYFSKYHMENYSQSDNKCFLVSSIREYVDYKKGMKNIPDAIREKHNKIAAKNISMQEQQLFLYDSKANLLLKKAISFYPERFEGNIYVDDKLEITVGDNGSIAVLGNIDNKSKYQQTIIYNKEGKQSFKSEVNGTISFSRDLSLMTIRNLDTTVIVNTNTQYSKSITNRHNNNGKRIEVSVSTLDNDSLYVYVDIYINKTIGAKSFYTTLQLISDDLIADEIKYNSP